MKLHELKAAEGSRRVRNALVVVLATGNGKTSGRGQKVKSTFRWWRKTWI